LRRYGDTWPTKPSRAEMLSASTLVLFSIAKIRPTTTTWSRSRKKARVTLLRSRVRQYQARKTRAPQWSPRLSNRTADGASPTSDIQDLQISSPSSRTSRRVGNKADNFASSDQLK